MKWVKISERFPEKDGWYLWWDGNYYTELYYIVGRPFGHLYTHWLKITGPEDVEDICEWKEDENSEGGMGYASSCGKEFPYMLLDNIHHCPNCGLPIKEIKP